MMTGDECVTHGFYTGEFCPACAAAEARLGNNVTAGGEHYELSRSPTPANYIGLQAVLDRAFEQAAYGKGADRHGQGQAFEEQPMQKLIQLYGTGFALGQAGKKMQEAQRMGTDAAVRELLGAINYIAGTIVHLEKTRHDEPEHVNR
jgi:hypothetical protein